MYGLLRDGDIDPCCCLDPDFDTLDGFGLVGVAGMDVADELDLRAEAGFGLSRRFAMTIGENEQTVLDPTSIRGLILISSTWLDYDSQLGRMPNDGEALRQATWLRGQFELRAPKIRN